MRELSKASLFLAFVLSGAYAGAQADGSAAERKLSPEEQILQRERDYTNGILHHDLKLLQSVFSADFVDTTADGRLHSRAELLSAIANSPVPAEITEKNRHISIYGGTAAVVTVEFTVTGKDHGMPYTYHGRATDLWALENGTWFCVAAHSSEIK